MTTVQELNEALFSFGTRVNQLVYRFCLL